MSLIKMPAQRFAVVTLVLGARRGYFSGPTRRRALAAALILPFVLCAVVVAQEQPQPPPTQPASSQSDDVIKIESNLIQAGVTVLDKQGRFVEGLKAEQFDVRVDGKPQKISFFDQVAAGTAEEKVKLASAARGAKPPEKAASTQPGAMLREQGRVVLFFLDDFHMEASSIARARKAIEHFADKEMGPNDLAAVATASGQLGFLQQLTGNRSVLKVAASRLRPRLINASDGQQPLMTEYIAKAILIEGDRELLETYVQPLLRDRTMRRPAAEAYVKERARAIHQLATEVTRNTLRGLQSMIRAVSPLAGRKLVVFLSDGFLLSYTDNETGEMVRNITDAAVRSGFVLYTIDSRGLATDTWVNAETPLPVDDMTGSVLRATRGEMSASQEALHQLAEETGGRALLNTNATNRGLSSMVNETAAYYVVAWQPVEGEQKGGKFHHLEVSVKDRPDLIVLVQRGFLERGSTATAPSSARGKEKDAKADELNTALAAAVPVRALPAGLSLSYLSEQKDSAVLTALLSVPIDSLGRNAMGEVAVEVRGYVVNLDGKIGSRFGERLSAKPTASQGSREQIMYRHQVKLAPGIYQVRAALMDLGGRRVGSVAEWIEIPDLKSNQLTLGSLVLGERPKETGVPLDAENFVSQRGSDYGFARASDLRFITYVYNAARGAQNAQPDLEAQIQVSRDGKPVFTDEWRKVDVTGRDPEHIAYGGEIALDTMSPGRYTLRLTVRDKVSKVEAAQSATFFVE